MGGLSQSDKLFGALLIAFIVYITVRGQLPAPSGYLGIFTHNSAPTSSSPASTASNAVSTATSIFSGITNALGVFGQLFGG